jgi:hypothetical protein
MSARRESRERSRQAQRGEEAGAARRHAAIVGHATFRALSSRWIVIPEGRAHPARGAQYNQSRVRWPRKGR